MIELKDFSLRYYSYDEATKDIIAVQTKPDSVENTIKKFIKIAKDNKTNIVLFEKIRLVCSYIIGKAKSKYADVKSGFFSGKVFGKSQKEVVADLETLLLKQIQNQSSMLRLSKQDLLIRVYQTQVGLDLIQSEMDDFTYKLKLLDLKEKYPSERNSIFPPTLTTEEQINKLSYAKKLTELETKRKKFEKKIKTFQEQITQIEIILTQINIPDLDRED